VPARSHGYGGIGHVLADCGRIGREGLAENKQKFALGSIFFHG